MSHLCPHNDTFAFCQLCAKDLFKAEVDNFCRKTHDLAMFAGEFQVAVSTIERWANGTAIPHPRLQTLILDWIATQ